MVTNLLHYQGYFLPRFKKVNIFLYNMNTVISQLVVFFHN